MHNPFDFCLLLCSWNTHTWIKFMFFSTGMRWFVTRTVLVGVVEDLCPPDRGNLELTQRLWPQIRSSPFSQRKLVFYLETCDLFKPRLSCDSRRYFRSPAELSICGSSLSKIGYHCCFQAWWHSTFWPLKPCAYASQMNPFPLPKTRIDKPLMANGAKNNDYEKQNPFKESWQ